MFDDGPRRFGDPWPHGTPGRRPPRQRTVGPHVRRLGVVYGINVFDPHAGSVVLGYVGQTFQRLWQREAQHREDQPWSDLIVGAAFVIAEGGWTCDEIDRVEAAYIRRLRPVYNHDHNLDNPRRVPIYVAREQRAGRDATRGMPRRVPPGRDRWGEAVRFGRWVWRWPPVRVAAVWLALAGGVLLVIPDTVAAGTAAGRAALAATAVTGLGWRLVQPRGRRRRRRR